MKDSDNHLMKQVFWETNGKNKEGNISTQPDIIMIILNVSPKNIEY